MKFKYLFVVSCAMSFIFLTTVMPAIATTDDKVDRVISPQAAAQALYELNLFKGTESGFELERGINRAEAAVMVVRLMGAEEEALENNNPHPFNDVPEWASPYIGWLFANNLTNGTGNDRYSPLRPITYEQYALFLTRAVNSYGVLDIDVYVLLTPGYVFGLNRIDQNEYMKNHRMTRGEAAILSVHALRLSKNGKTIALRLIEKEVFNGEQLLEHLGSLFGEQYVKDEVLFEYPLLFEGEETSFFASGDKLYLREGENLTTLFKAEFDHRCRYEIIYIYEQKTFLRFYAEKSYIFCYDTIQQKLINTGLSLDNFINLYIVKGNYFFLSDDTDIYCLNLADNTWKHLYQPGRARNSPDGFCKGLEGIVAILQDGSILYFNNEITEPIFPKLWDEYWTYDTKLISYDGETLIFSNKTMFDKAGGHFIYYIYTVVATKEKVICSGLECIDHESGIETIKELDKEISTATVKDFQAWLDKLYGVE